MEARGDLELPPDGLLVLQQVANALKLVPLLVDQILALVVDDAQAVDHARALVLVEGDLGDSPRWVDLKRLLRLARALLKPGSLSTHERTPEPAREAKPHLEQVRRHAHLDAAELDHAVGVELPEQGLARPAKLFRVHHAVAFQLAKLRLPEVGLFVGRARQRFFVRLDTASEGRGVDVLVVPALDQSRTVAKELLAVPAHQSIVIIFLILTAAVLPNRIGHCLDSVMRSLEELLHDLMILIQKGVQLFDQFLGVDLGLGKLGFDAINF